MAELSCRSRMPRRRVPCPRPIVRDRHRGQVRTPAASPVDRDRRSHRGRRRLLVRLSPLLHLPADDGGVRQDQARVRRDPAAAGGLSRELGRPRPRVLHLTAARRRQPDAPPAVRGDPRAPQSHRHQGSPRRVLRASRRRPDEVRADLRLVRGRIHGPQVRPDAAALRDHGHPVGRRQRQVPGHGPARGELQQRDRGGDDARRPGAQGAAGRLELGIGQGVTRRTGPNKFNGFPLSRE